MSVARASLDSPSAVPPDTPRRHVGILHLLGKPGVAAVGGGEGVAFHAAQALSTTYRVTLFSDFEGVHEPARWLEDMNDYWGTDLSPNDLAIRPLDLPSAPPNRLPIARGVETLWRKQRFYAALPQRFPEIDAWVSTLAPSPVPAPVLHYVHYPNGRKPWVLFTDRALGHLTGTSLDKAYHTRTLANSEWTAERCHEEGSEDVRVVYPPVTWPADTVAWDRRNDDMVCLGRITPSKRFEAVVDVAVALRARGLLRNLHIIGPEVDPAYAADLDAYRTEVGGDPWIQVHGALPRSRVQTLLTRSKYGIHAMIDEHFGMAPAEMLAAGCIPFIHASGGQQEIVGGAPNLLFESHEDAVAKIAAVARDATVQAAVLRSLEPVRDRFSLRRFHDEIVQEVDALLAASPSS